MDGRTAAAVLGVTPEATRDEIRRAFRARAKTAHPDTHGTDEAFVTLRAAADLLLASAPGGHTASPDPTFPAAVTGRAPGDAAAPGSVGGPVGAVGRRARWERRPAAPRPGAAIDLTDRPVGRRCAHPAAAKPTSAGADAFTRILDAELSRR